MHENREDAGTRGEMCGGETLDQYFSLTRTATHSCRIRKRAVHVYSPGVAAVRPLLLGRCYRIAAAPAAAAAADAAVYRQFDD